MGLSVRARHEYYYIFLFLTISTGTNDPNEEISSGSRPLPISNEEWNQQTIVDTHNVLQSQLSNEPSHQFNEQRSVKNKLDFFSLN